MYFSLKYETAMAAFWATHFHKSDAEETSRNSIDGIKDVIAQMRVVLGNVDTEHTIVHGVEALKITRDYVKKSIESIREDVARVRKMKGPRGERGNGWLSGAHAPSGEVESTGRTGDFYLDTSTLTVYKKLASGWHAFGTLQGLKGQPGQQGPPAATHTMHTGIRTASFTSMYNLHTLKPCWFPWKSTWKSRILLLSFCPLQKQVSYLFGPVFKIAEKCLFCSQGHSK